MKEWIFKVLFARFVPHRTAIGLGLAVLAQVLGALNAGAVCDASPAVCDFLGKAQDVLTPWLVIAGIRDKDRK